MHTTYLDLLEGPNESQMCHIHTALNEDPERLTHTHNIFKKWVAFQPHLPKNIEDRVLTLFLRGCKHDLERAKRKLELYYSVRRSCPEIYSKRDPNDSEIQFAARMVNHVPLPKLTDDGYRVTVNKLGSNDASLFDIESVIKYIIMMGDIRVHTETAIAGDIYIIDLANNLTVPHCAKAASISLKRAFAIATEAYPQRIKCIHFVNAPQFIDKFLTALKTVMKEKIRKRFVVHKTLDTLLEQIQPDVLPAEYNGTGGHLDEIHSKWQREMLNRSDWFAQQEKMTSESAPIPRHLYAHSCALDSTDGIQGSFRALTID